MWISRTPLRPSDQRAYLRNTELLTAIVEAYGFYVSHEHRHDHKRALLNWRLRRFWYPAVLVFLGPVVMGMIVLEQRDWGVEGFALLDASPVVAYFVAALLGYSLLRWGGSTIFNVAYILLLLVAAAFLAIGFDRTEITQLLGLSASCAAGFYVTTWKNWDLLWLTAREVADDRFRSIYTITATWSVVTATCFGAYQILIHAVDGAFVQGDTFLVFLIVVVVLALGEFFRSQIAK